MQKWHSREREDVLSTEYPPDLLIGKIGHVDGGYSYLHPDIVCGMTQYISIVAPSPAFEAKKNWEEKGFGFTKVVFPQVIVILHLV